MMNCSVKQNQTMANVTKIGKRIERVEVADG
jgi:hypothetical protein